VVPAIPKAFFRCHRIVICGTFSIGVIDSDK
jgi:hypothetical protein